MSEPHKGPVEDQPRWPGKAGLPEAELDFNSAQGAIFSAAKLD